MNFYRLNLFLAIAIATPLVLALVGHIRARGPFDSQFVVLGLSDLSRKLLGFAPLLEVGIAGLLLLLVADVGDVAPIVGVSSGIYFLALALFSARLYKAGADTCGCGAFESPPSLVLVLRNVSLGVLSLALVLELEVAVRPSETTPLLGVAAALLAVSFGLLLMAGPSSQVAGSYGRY